MDGFKIAIIAVGYNRPDSMKKLLNSVIAAEYYDDRVDLIISIDKGNRQPEIIQEAEAVKWDHGEKIIRAFPERQGLRAHIIQCGDLTEKYDAVVVLEDDLMVSPFFYLYVIQAIGFYDNEKKIAGISLYKHLNHPGVNRPFEPVNNGYDTYMMQFAQSWGQCWTKNMWSFFKKWYLKNVNKDLSDGGILPNYIAGWNKQSWLKYYMRYIVENDLYFVYPMISLSTNASDVGEHCAIPNNDYQVPLLQGDVKYRFATFNNAIKYDVFFERQGIALFPELQGNKILDLYGGRTNYKNADYLISTQSLPYKVEKSFQLKYRPVEMNCISPDDGDGAYVYNLHFPAKSPMSVKDIVTRYDVKGIHWKKLLSLGFSEFRMAVSERLSKVRKK